MPARAQQQSEFSWRHTYHGVRIVSRGVANQPPTIGDQQGAPVSGIAVTAGNATAVTDATGMFVLTGLQAGGYAVTPASASFSFSPALLTVTLVDRNIGGLSFQANPPIVPASYTLSPWTMIGAGVTTTAIVTLTRPAPAGGAVLTLSASDPKAAKVPSTVTVAGGQSSVSFPVQGSGVAATTTVTLAAGYNGGTATTSLTVAPGDSLHITRRGSILSPLPLWGASI